MNALSNIERGGGEPALIDADPAGLDFADLRVFTTVPDHRDFDVVAMHGLVIVFDRSLIAREDIQAGKLYVRESQRPSSCMPWESWLECEWAERDRRCGPSSRLQTRREVVQAIKHRSGGPALRMASGGVDGPYHDWAFGLDLIGKVVGVYRSSAAAAAA